MIDEGEQIVFFSLFFFIINVGGNDPGDFSNSRCHF